MDRPKPVDYTYDISVEDLKRYRQLPPREILRWLGDVNDFMRKLQATPGFLPSNPIVSDDNRKSQ